MNLQRIKPWNWFKHEEDVQATGNVPVKKHDDLKAAGRSMYVPLANFHREVDRLFDNVFSGFPSLSGTSSLIDDSFFKPQVDISGNDKSYEITLNVPGLKREDISIELQGDSLLIKGEKQEKNESKDKHYYRIERSYGTFQRVLALPEDANAKEISADLKDGVLCLTVPRSTVANKEVKRITIN